MNYNHLRAGLFLFNHSCMTTLAVRAGKFFGLYKGTIFSHHELGSPACPLHCLHESDLRTCPVKCECAYVREVMQIIKNRHIPAEVQESQ